VYPDTTTAPQINKKGSRRDFASLGLGHDHSPPLIVGGAPFTDVFHMAKAAKADFLLVQPTQADTR
jgi:hypothetical protein